MPVVQQRRRRAALRAEHRARRRRDAGRPLPARVDRPAEAAASRAGLDVENGLHVFLERRPRAARARGAPRRRAARPAPAAGRSLDRDRREPRGARHDRAHRRLRLRDREDDRRRSSSTSRRGGAASASVFVPTGQTGIAIAGWGIAVDAVVADFIAGAAERLVVEGARARAASCSGSRARARSSIRSTPASRSASTTAARRTCSSSATRPGTPRSRARAAGRTRSRRFASSSSCTSGSRCPRGRRGSPRSRSTRAGSRTRTRPRRDRGRRGRDRPARRRPGPLRRGAGSSTRSPASPDGGCVNARRSLGSVLRSTVDRKGRGREEIRCGSHRRARARDCGRSGGRPADRLRRGRDEVRRRRRRRVSSTR